MNVKCEQAVETLLQVGINLLAIDFDVSYFYNSRMASLKKLALLYIAQQTLVDCHTRGAFRGEARALEQNIRPVFRALLPFAFKKGMSRGNM